MYLTQIVQPDIVLYGLRIQEPVIVLTNFMVSIVCFYAYNSLGKSNDRATQLMRSYFLVFGISTIVGGLLGHAFIYALGFSWKLAGWFLAMFSIFILEFAALEHAKPYLSTKTIRAISAIHYMEMAIAIVLTSYFLDFNFVQIHTVYGVMLVFLPLHIMIYRKTKALASKYMIYAVLVLSSTLIVYTVPIVIHTYFNHGDLAHVIISVSILLMLKGTALYLDKVLTQSPSLQKEGL